MERNKRAVWIQLLSLLLVACGGGGGSGGDSNREGTGRPAVSVTAAKTSINLSQTVAEAARTETVRLTFANVPDAGLWIEISYADELIESLDSIESSASVLDTIVQFRQPGDLVPAVYLSDIEFRVCADDQCSRLAIQNPIRIAVEMEVIGLPPMSIDVTPAPLAVEAMLYTPEIPGISAALTFDIPIKVTPYFELQYGDALFRLIEATSVSGSGIELRIDMLDPQLFGIGTYSDDLRVDLCYTPSCVNRISDPIVSTVTYRVAQAGSLPEPGVPPLAVLWRQALAHDVVDAEYSKTLDAIVMVSSYPTDALHVYEAGTAVETQLPLTRTPTSVSIAPSGLSAAVGHDGRITHVDLEALLAGASDPSIILDTHATVGDIVLDGAGTAHVLSRWGSHMPLHSIDVATNTEQLGITTFYQGSFGKLHPSGQSIYAMTRMLSPDDLFKIDISSLPGEVLYDSPYHGDYGMCGNFWISDDGERIFTACGSLFHTSTVRANDMLYAGSLTRTSGGRYFEIRSLSELEAANEILVTEQTGGISCELLQFLFECYSHVSLHGLDSLQRTGLFSLPPIEEDGVDYGQTGLFVFHSADGTRRFLLSKLLDIENAEPTHYLSEL